MLLIRIVSFGEYSYLTMSPKTSILLMKMKIFEIREVRLGGYLSFIFLVSGSWVTSPTRSKGNTLSCESELDQNRKTSNEGRYLRTRQYPPPPMISSRGREFDRRIPCNQLVIARPPLQVQSLSMAPAGAHLTLQQLINALTYKVAAAQKKAK